MVRLVLLYSRKRADAREEGISDPPAVSCAVPFSPEGVLSENTNSFVDETPAFLYTILGKKEINMASCQSDSILQSFSAQAEGQRTNRLTDRQNEKSGQLSWINPVWDNRSPYGRRRSFHIKRTKQYQEGIFTLRIRENSFLVFSIAGNFVPCYRKTLRGIARGWRGIRLLLQPRRRRRILRGRILCSFIYRIQAA